VEIGQWDDLSLKFTQYSFRVVKYSTKIQIAREYEKVAALLFFLMQYRYIGGNLTYEYENLGLQGTGSLSVKK
jgi:hypothetical protein